MGRRVFRTNRKSEALRVICFLAVVSALVVLVYIGIGNLGATQEERQLEIAQDAIVRAAVQCYALESRFPSSLDYLVDNYGLTLDESKYIYHYRVDGSNFVPHIRVIPLDTAGRGR